MLWALFFFVINTLLAPGFAQPTQHQPSASAPPSPANGPIESGSSTKIIPLPIYSTLPNEGSTYGFMPVFMTVENATQRTESIIAPSISWNRVIRFTHTFRIYRYFSNTESLTLIPSFSTNINRGLTFRFDSIPRKSGSITNESYLFFRRSLFYRFFGIGPETRSGSEASYTRLGGETGARVGYNFTPDLNLGAHVRFERQLVERKNVDFLPLAPAVFPGAPGMGGSTTLYEGLSLRYDTRGELRETAEKGFFTEATAGIAQGLYGTDHFGKFTYEAKGMWPQFKWLSGAARAFWGYTAGNARVPFYNQNSLGGSFFLRGFTQDRFIDKGSWEATLEQRIVLLKMRIYGVVADWRVDPFVSVGQVYADAKDIVRYAKVTGGLGFRAFVHPNVLGRVDTAVGGEGIKVYVELGYPF